MNDLDDIRRAIDDSVFAHGRTLEPTDEVRRALARRRIAQRAVVLTAAASVAAIVGGAVYLGTTTNSDRLPTAALSGDSTVTTTAAPESPTLSPSLRVTPTAVSDASTGSTPTASEVPPLSASAPTGLDYRRDLVAEQWAGSTGSIVLIDPTDGSVLRTYTSGVTDNSHGVIVDGTNAYFAATDDKQGCVTRWSGVALATGAPAAADTFLDGRSAAAIAISPSGTLAVAECGTSSRIVIPGSGLPEITLATAVDSVRAMAWSANGMQLAYITNPPGSGVGAIHVLSLQGHAASRPPDELQLPDGCTPTALTYATRGLVAGLKCARSDTTSYNTILSYDAGGALVSRKDLTSSYKEATVSDVAVRANGDVFYVVNYEGVNSDVFRLSEGVDQVVAKDLFSLDVPRP